MGLLTGAFGSAASTKFYDETTTLRIYDVVGDVAKYNPQAGIATDDTTGVPTSMVVTQTGTNTIVNSVTAGNTLTITTGATEYNGVNAQVKGEKFIIATGKPLYFGAKLSIDDATQSDILIGLAETKTDLLKTSTAHGVLATAVEGVFFTKIDGVTTINAMTYEAGTLTNSAACGTAIDTAAHIYEIVWDGTSQLSFYFDGVIVGTFTGTIANGDLTPSINVRAGSAQARVCEVSWIRCFQARS